jgi:hypothetical protein
MKLKVKESFYILSLELSWIRGIYMNMEEIYKIYEGYKIKK